MRASGHRTLLGNDDGSFSIDTRGDLRRGKCTKDGSGAKVFHSLRVDNPSTWYGMCATGNISIAKNENDKLALLAKVELSCGKSVKDRVVAL